MPTTITSFYTFTPDTKARSTEVNTNFNNYRGSILPVNTDTQTASDNTHDLGVSDHRWANAYITNNIYMGTASSHYIKMSSGVFEIVTNGVLRVKIDDDGLDGSGIKSVSIPFSAFADRTVTEDGSDPGVGGISISSPQTSVWSTDTVSYHDVTALACELTTRGGPVMIELIGTTIGGRIFLDYDNNIASTSNMVESADFMICLSDNTVIGGSSVYVVAPTRSDGTLVISNQCNFKAIYNNVAGTYNFKLRVLNTSVNGAATVKAGVASVKLMAYEI